MNMKHKVTINVADRTGNKQSVLQSGTISLPKRLLAFLFGDFTDVLVLMPAASVEGVEIQEVGNREGGDRNAESD